MSQFEITIGGTQTDQINAGETLSVSGVWQDGAGNPLDLTGGSIDVLQSFPASISEDMRVTIDNAAGGAFSLFMGTAAMAKLHDGRRNWFRLRLVMSELSTDTTSKIWIQIS